MSEVENLKNLGKKANKEGNFSIALKFYSHGLTLDPNNYILFGKRASVQQALSNFLEALGDSQSAIDINPKWPKAYIKKGVACYYLELYDDAIVALTTVLKLDPNNTVAQNLLKEVQNLKNKKDSKPLSQTQFYSLKTSSLNLNNMTTLELNALVNTLSTKTKQQLIQQIIFSDTTLVEEELCAFSLSSNTKLNGAFLPSEVILYIFSLLDGISLQTATGVCCLWKDLVGNNTYLWRKLVESKWQISSHDDQLPFSYDWKELFKMLYKRGIRFNSNQMNNKFDGFSKVAVGFLNRIYKGFSPDNTEGDYIHTAKLATPIWYHYDPELNKWRWSPDQRVWMICPAKKVIGGRWSGQAPVEENVKLIKFLAKFNPVPAFVLSSQLIMPK